MSIPNIQQQMYLKKALNESTDGMFDHPTLDSSDESIVEGVVRKLKGVKPLKTAEEKARAKKFAQAAIARRASGTSQRVHTTGGDWKTPEDLKESYGHRLSYYGATPTLAQINLERKYGPEGYSAIVKAAKSHKGPLAFNINDVHRVGTAAKKAAQARADAANKSSK